MSIPAIIDLNLSLEQIQLAIAPFGVNTLPEIEEDIIILVLRIGRIIDNPAYGLNENQIKLVFFLFSKLKFNSLDVENRVVIRRCLAKICEKIVLGVIENRPQFLIELQILFDHNQQILEAVTKMLSGEYEA